MGKGGWYNRTLLKMHEEKVLHLVFQIILVLLILDKKFYIFSWEKVFAQKTCLIPVFFRVCVSQHTIYDSPQHQAFSLFKNSRQGLRKTPFFLCLSVCLSCLSVCFQHHFFLSIFLFLSSSPFILSVDRRQLVVSFFCVHLSLSSWKYICK